MRVLGGMKISLATSAERDPFGWQQMSFDAIDNSFVRGARRGIWETLLRELAHYGRLARNYLASICLAAALV